MCSVYSCQPAVVKKGISPHPLVSREQALGSLPPWRGCLVRSSRWPEVTRRSVKRASCVVHADWLDVVFFFPSLPSLPFLFVFFFLFSASFFSFIPFFFFCLFPVSVLLSPFFVTYSAISCCSGRFAQDVGKGGKQQSALFLTSEDKVGINAQ